MKKLPIYTESSGLRCSIIHGWCSPMGERISDTKTGFNTVTTINLRSGKTRLIGIVYRRNAKDRGLMLNVCPWCGSDLQFFNEVTRRSQAAGSILITRRLKDAAKKGLEKAVS